jgi:xylan 1,4-beta-xylosidase
MSYWVFSDIFEEAGPPPTPFHGGFGLLNLQGIRKPAYFAFQFMNRLGPTALRNADAASWVTRDQAGNIQILIWDLTNPAGGSSNQTVFRKINEPKSKGNVTITLNHMPAGGYRCTRWQVGYEKNDAYSA